MMIGGHLFKGKIKRAIFEFLFLLIIKNGK